MKLLFIVLASFTGVVILSEIALRITTGLGNPPLYVADRELGYLLAPNQKLRRFGNRFETNQYSMRSREITESSDRPRILLLGDSVVNGSWWTDQNETLSNLLAERQDNTIEVLNASANSWGPRNELAYLKQFGLFDADTLVLIINTDDLFAGEPTSSAVGNFSYPDRPPALALVELYQTFIVTPQPSPEPELEVAKDRLEKNLAAIVEIKAIADAANTRFILVLTPLLREFESATADELAARKQLQELVTAEKIDYIDVLQAWADFPQPEFLYRDRIHPSPQGNNKIVEAIYDLITAD